MPFKKPLPGDRSSPRLVAGRDTTRTALVSRPEAIEDDDGALPILPNSEAPESKIPAAVFGPMARFFGHIALCGEAGFLQLLVAATSWVMAEALTGCLAYAVAMYSVELKEPIDGRDPAGKPPLDREDRDSIPVLPSHLRSPGDRTLRSVRLSRRDFGSFAHRAGRCE